MKACIRQDASRSRGSAIIAVDGAAPFEGNPSYIIESSDGLYLTPTGWASVKTPITAADGDYIYSRGDGTLNISIGPDVLNKLDSLSAYRISVNGEAPVSLRVPEELSLGLMQEASGVAGDIPKAAPEEALREAKAMRTEKASSDDNDGAFLLLEDAAGNGNAEAMYLYAQFYDPTCTRPRGTIEPDMAQAHDWYKKALDAGYSGAAQDLERLKAAVAEKAKSGDAEAGRLLRAW